MVAIGIIGGDPMISMALRGSIIPHEELGGPLPMMCFEEQGRIAGSAGKFENVTAEFVSGGQIAGNHVIAGFTAKGDEQLVLVARFLRGKLCEPWRRPRGRPARQSLWPPSWSRPTQSGDESPVEGDPRYPARMQPVRVPCSDEQSPRG